MIVLPVAAGTVVTFTAVWFVWSARRLWLYGEPKPLRATVTVTVVRPVRSPRPEAERPDPSLSARRVSRGEIEPPRG